MNNWKLQRINLNIYALSGKLTYETVPGLWALSSNKFLNIKSVTFDLSEITQSDSSGVALLISWTRDFHRRYQKVYFSQLPRQMLAIIQLAGLDSILPIRNF